MKFNKFLKRSSVFALAFSAMAIVAYACGWHPNESDFLSFMRPEIVQSPKTAHLAFDPSAQFYWSSMQESGAVQEGNDKTQNVQSWQNYIGKGVPTEDIEFVIYAFPFDELQVGYRALEQNKKWIIPELWRNNQMLLWLTQKKNREALRYLVLAKKAEPLSTKDYDPWNPTPIDTELVKICLNESIDGFTKTKTPFFKARYAFQIIKNAFYGEQYGQCLDHFVNYAMPVEGLDVYLDKRMYAYRAGALYKQGKKAEAAYCFAMLFDKTQDVNLAYQHSLGFVWSEKETPLQEVLAYCGNNKHERSVVYALYGMRQTEPFQTQYLDSCFQYDANNELLDVLLLREINKAELAYLQMRADIERGYYVYDGWTGGPLFGLNEEIKQSDLFKKNGVPQPLQSLSSYVDRMAKSEKVANPALWKMSAGYLAYMCEDEDYTNAQYWYKQAARSNPSEAIQNQLKVLNLLYTLRDANALPMAQETKILEGLEQVEALSKSNAMYLPVFRNVLRSELPAYFLRKNDTLRMMLSYHRFENSNSYKEPDANNNQIIKHFSDYSFSNSGHWMNHYFSQEQLDAVVTMQHNNSNPLDRWLLKGNEYNQRIVNELKGVKYFRAFEYEKALSILKGQQDLPTVPDIFHMYVNDYQDIGENQMEQEYTTAEVLQQLIDLKKKAPTDPFSAYRYASVLYSLSYHGRCHYAWNFHRDYTDTNPYYYDKENGNYTPFDMQFFYADEAYTWFRKAYTGSKDPIVKQNALWMMAKCEQKRCPLEQGNPYWNDADADSYVKWNVNQNVWLAQFHKQFKGTAFYNKVFEECAYLQLFAAQH